MNPAPLDLRAGPADGAGEHTGAGRCLDAGLGHHGVETGLAERVVAGQDLRRAELVVAQRALQGDAVSVAAPSDLHRHAACQRVERHFRM